MADAEFIISSCDPQNFSGVDADKWTCIKSKIQDRYGVIINKDKGTASKSGFTFVWDHNPGAQTLVVQCTEKPFFVPCSTVNSRIQDIGRECGV